MPDSLADAAQSLEPVQASAADDEQIGLLGEPDERVDRLARVDDHERRQRVHRVEVDVTAAGGRDDRELGVESLRERLRDFARPRARPGEPSAPTTMLAGNGHSARGGRATSTEHGALCSSPVATPPRAIPTARCGRRADGDERGA